MFSICPQKVYKNKGLSALDVRVYLAIQGFANDDGFCFPSVARIADECGISRRAVFKSLSKLEQSKVIAREKRMRDDGGYSSNAYYLKLEPDNNDVNNCSQGEVNERSLPSERECTSNKNQITKNVNLKFTNSARARVYGRTITAGDLAHVSACKSSVEGAVNYQFFLSNETICARAFGRIYQDLITESEIVRFFADNFNERVRVFEWNTKALDEQDIGG